MYIFFSILACAPDKETIDSGDVEDTSSTIQPSSEDTSQTEDTSTTDTTEICDNGIDDDADGATDCLDEECAQTSACTFIPQTKDYSTYARNPGTGFSEASDDIPLPEEECADAIILSGSNIDCMIPEGTCAIIESGTTVTCEQDMMVHGTLWVQSDEPTQKTLLITDAISVHGALFVSGSTTQEAQNVELFLRHEYCGLPENEYALTSTSDPDCQSRGHLNSHAGIVKITGRKKTSWSLLTKDSDQTPGSVVVDDCTGWNIGDELVITATGGDETSWTGLINHGFASGTQAETKWKAEKRSISDIDTSSCTITLNEELETNHRGNPVPSPNLRLQAEVLNQTRSVLITGGYLSDLDDPQTRVATSYDYSHNSGTPMVDYENNESVPCKTCQTDINGVLSPDGSQCDIEESCTYYENEDKQVYSCGEDCGTMGSQGITTAQMHGGVMQLSYTAVEHCGRRNLAEYCLHMHHVGDVQYRVWSQENQTESYFIGNSIQNGINKGITIHGTHRALVQHNIVYNHRGPGIYIEDGNEIENIIEENAIVCSEINTVGSLGAMKRNSLCRFKNAANRPQTSDSDYDESSGLYFLSSYNHVIGNRVSGYDNAMYVNAQGGAASLGLGMAAQKACVSAYPFGFTVGNVFHNNAGFGWYANTTFPQNIMELGGMNIDYTNGDANIGTIKDWSTCQPFSPSGEDQSANILLQNHTEYFNDFSAGGYDLGDVSFTNYTSYGGNKAMYWKSYRRGENSGPLCTDCTFINTNFDLMGGSALVEFKDTHFYRDNNNININHHCRVGNAATGGLCASHFDFRTSHFYDYDAATESYNPASIFFRSEVDDTSALIFSPDDVVFVQQDAIVLDVENDSRCQPSSTENTPQAGWWACDESSLGLRIVRLYAPNRGTLTVTNHTDNNQTFTIPWQSNGTQESVAARIYPYAPYCTPGFFSECPNYMYAAGYTFAVPDQAEISLHFSESVDSSQPLYDLLTIEYSEEQLQPQTSITIRSLTGTELMDSTTPCLISSTHSRAFITPFGPMNAASGAWYNDCTSWDVQFSLDDYFAAADNFATSDSEPSMEPAEEPASEPSQEENETGTTLYLGEASLHLSPPTTAVQGTVPANSGYNVNTIPADPSLVTTLSHTGLTGIYDGGEIELNLSVDTSSVAQALQARVQIDFDGDGNIDLEQMYNYWALDAALGTWEEMSASGIASQSGTWSDMNNGSISISLWNSFGGDNIQYQIPTSTLSIPIQ